MPTPEQNTYTIGGYTVTLTPGRVEGANIVVNAERNDELARFLLTYITQGIRDNYIAEQTFSPNGLGSTISFSATIMQGDTRKELTREHLEKFLSAFENQFPDKASLKAMQETTIRGHATAFRQKQEAAAEPYISAAKAVLDNTSLSKEDQAQLLASLTVKFKEVAVAQAKGQGRF